MFNIFQTIFNKKKYNYYNMDNIDNNKLSKQNTDKENVDNLIDLSINNINENDISYFSFIGKTFIAKPCHIYDRLSISTIHILSYGYIFIFYLSFIVKACDNSYIQSDLFYNS